MIVLALLERYYALSTTTGLIMSSVNELPHAQRERLAFIDFSLQYFGCISRKELIERFKTGLAASTRDFSTYKQLAPHNLELNHVNKQYLRTPAFKSLFRHDPEVILTSLSRGFGNGISSGVQASHVCMDAVRLIHPDAEIIAAIMRAIYNRKAIRSGYISLSSGETERELVPHAIVNNGHRWHVRAFDRSRQAFRDFVCTRFTFVEGLSADVSELETNRCDEQWNRVVTLELVAHPSIQFKKAIEMDYSMQDGALALDVRAALAAYILRQWQVDCSSNNKLKGCQLALANKAVLNDIENTSLVPGFAL